MLSEPRLWRTGIASAELAQRFGVTVRQLRRDRELLERFVFPTRALVSEDGVRRMRFQREHEPTPCPGLATALARHRLA